MQPTSTETIKLALRRNSRSRLVLTEPEPPSLKMGNRPTKRPKKSLAG